MKESKKNVDHDCISPRPLKRTRIGGGIETTKKLSATRNGTDNSSCATLNLDVLTVVMSFVSPRQLLNLSQTCRPLHDAVTTELVVKSAMIYGGHAIKTMEELYPLFQKQSIYVPSPNRLLSLANGKRCEHCLISKVNHVRPNYGLFLCWHCLTTHFTRAWRRVVRTTEILDPIIHHDRTAGSVYSFKKYLMSEHFKTGGKKDELNGPIVCYSDLVDIANHHTSNDNNNYEHYLRSVLDAPTEEAYGDFINVFEGCKERARIVEVERYNKKKEACARNKNRKKEKVLKIVEDLKPLLKEPWRKAATIFDDVAPTKRNGSIKFRSLYVQSLMETYILSPSKIRKKLLKEISDKINTKFVIILEKKFLNYDFLLSNEETKDSFANNLKNHVFQDLSSIETLISKKNWLINEEWFDLLKKNQLFEALAYLYNSDFAFLLLLSSKDDSKFLRMAKYLYKVELRKCILSNKNSNEDTQYYKNTKPPRGSIREHSKAFNESKSTLKKMRNSIDAYSMWVSEKYTKDDFKDKLRLEWAVKNVFDDTSTMPFLLNGDFDGLDKHQDDGFKSYWEYRLH